jgi:hypothetical protein
MAHDRPIVGNYLDIQVFRVAAALPGAGAYDPAPLALDCPEFNFLTLYLSYTRAAVGGAVAFYLEASPDAAGLDWYRATMYDAGALAPGADVNSNIQREIIAYGSTAAGIQRVVFGPLVIQGGVQRLRIPCAESGGVASGTVELRGFFS